jgi:hypothetical protein
MNVSKLLPSNEHKTQQAVARQLVSKWEKTGLLEGLNKEYENSGMAVLLENQAKQLVTEANTTGTQANSEEWAGVALPLVRRIFAEIAAKDFVSVQPMNLPSGLVFFLDFKYGTSQPGFVTNAGRNSQRDSVFGVTDASKNSAGIAGVEGLYGAGRFGYSINEVTSSGLTANTSLSSTQYTTSSLGASDYNFNAEFSASYLAGKAAGTMFTVTIQTASLSGLDVNGVRSFVPTATNIVTFFPEFTKYSSTTGTIKFVVSGSVTASAGGTITVAYSKQPTATSRGDFEAGNVNQPLDANGKIIIPEINLELRSEAITAKTRKLKALWTPEFAQDLNAYHSIDAEAELTSMLSEYISQEIDLEILDMLISNAQTVEYWSVINNNIYDSATNSFAIQSSGYYNTQAQWFQTLGTKIQKVSNTIHKLTMRGGANFLVCSPTVATILESIPGYAVDTDGDKMEFAMGVQKVGMINNRFTVYKNPYMTENTILMGYRGAQFLETGAVYAPYIPLMMTPLVYDPTDFTPRKGVMTRYAKKVVRPEFYGKIYVQGLNTL